MSRLIDADALERDGWQMSRTVRVTKDTMEFQTRKPTDFPTIEPRKKGKWKPFDLTWGRSIYACSACGHGAEVPTEMGDPIYNFCPNCGADMRGRQDDNNY